ncbi:uncharacterized protein [Atheta coriaria]|uniref:uncharacterized protein n=1 Tax=Dalotia coriaria TaxID=877792 RepID=UPI0031F41015
MHLGHITYSIWCFILYHYTSAKFMLKNVTNNESALFILALLPTLLLLLMTALITIIFGTYKGFVYACLKIWYGRKFVKFVPGCGVVTSFHDKDFNHISVLSRITTHLSGNELFDQINDQIFEKFFITDIRNELFCLCPRQMGYSFIVNIRDLEIEEVFREIKTDKTLLTEIELQDYVNKFFGSPMPRNNELAFDMALCTTPIEDDENTEGLKTYAFFFRVKHALGDGLVFYNLLSNAFTTPCEANESYVKKLTQPNEKIDKLKECASHVINVHQGPTFDRQLIWSENTLTSGQFVSREEDCIWKIREVRKCFPGVTFLNVVIAAYTASLADYFKKYIPDNIPANINIACPLQLNVGRIQRMLTQGGKNDFDNDFSAFQLVCPVVVDKNTGESLIQRLMLVQAEFERVFKSFDIISMYITFKVFLNILPLPMVKIFCHRLFFATMFSCIPGGPKREFFNGAKIKCPTFYIPLQHALGIGVSILTYDDKMQVGFSLDATKFDSQDKIDMLINGFFNYIDLIYQESVKRLNSNSISRL